MIESAPPPDDPLEIPLLFDRRGKKCEPLSGKVRVPAPNTDTKSSEEVAADRDLADEPPENPILRSFQQDRVLFEPEPEPDLETEVPRSSGPYSAKPTGIIWFKEVDNPVPLTNFMARIVAEVERDDGAERVLYFEIEADLRGRCSSFTVTASEFQGLHWVHRELGARAIIFPGFTKKDHARAAIQMLSDNILRRTVFTHTGWRKVGNCQVYLHAAGAIGPSGTVPDVETDLSAAGLGGFQLPDPPAGDELRKATRATLGVIDLAPLTVSVPLFATIPRAPLGSTDLSVQLAGPTGAGKSELVALVQQHYGAAMDARHLPASWSSTGNALEVQAFAAKDAVLVVDDFAPGGTAQDRARLNREAARIFRAQGNLSGRARLRPDATLRPIKAPRGLILSTGEDVGSSGTIGCHRASASAGSMRKTFTFCPMPLLQRRRGWPAPRRRQSAWGNAHSGSA